MELINLNTEVYLCTCATSVGLQYGKGCTGIVLHSVVAIQEDICTPSLLFFGQKIKK